MPQGIQKAIINPGLSDLVKLCTYTSVHCCGVFQVQFMDGSHMVRCQCALHILVLLSICSSSTYLGKHHPRSPMSWP